MSQRATEIETVYWIGNSIVLVLILVTVRTGNGFPAALAIAALIAFCGCAFWSKSALLISRAFKFRVYATAIFWTPVILLISIPSIQKSALAVYGLGGVSVIAALALFPLLIFPSAKPD